LPTLCLALQMLANTQVFKKIARMTRAAGQ
jgi:hypothetical protein